MQFLSENRLSVVNGCQNFWTVRFLKTEYEPNFGFPRIPTADDDVEEEKDEQAADAAVRWRSLRSRVHR